MKTPRTAHLLFLLCLGFECVEGQNKWIQTQINAGTGYGIYASSTDIYAATSDGVYSTADSGMPWILRGPAGRSVYDVIKSHQYILAATYSGVFRSSDNGTTWLPTGGLPSSSGTGGTVGPRIFAQNSSYVFAAIWAAGVFRSSDDGNSWQQLSVGTREPYYGDIGQFSSCICAAGERIIISVQVSRPAVYFSADNGVTWDTRTINAPMAGSLLFLSYDSGRLFAGGATGLYVSADKGDSWTAQYNNTVGSDGKVIGLGSFRDVVSYGQNLVAAVDFKSIQISRDNGKSWSNFSEGLISDWSFSALAIKSPYVWAIRGFFGNIYRRPLAEAATAVGEESANLPGGYVLSQNYPNPFNPTTAISYQLSAKTFVSLRVFDVLGAEVAVLANELKEAGRHSVSLNAQDFASGVYFYRLQTDRVVETKKMILLR